MAILLCHEPYIKLNCHSSLAIIELMLAMQWELSHQSNKTARLIPPKNKIARLYTILSKCRTLYKPYIFLILKFCNNEEVGKESCHSQKICFILRNEYLDRNHKIVVLLMHFKNVLHELLVSDLKLS